MIVLFYWLNQIDNTKVWGNKNLRIDLS